MSVYRKIDGELKKIAGNMTQVVEPRLIKLTHSVENDKDYYSAEGLAFNSNTIYTFYIDESNETNEIYIVLGGAERQLLKASGEEIEIEELTNRFNGYTLELEDDEIYLEQIAGGGSVDIDNVTITENSDGQIQAVGLTDGTSNLDFEDIYNAITIRRHT